MEKSFEGMLPQKLALNLEKVDRNLLKRCLQMSSCLEKTQLLTLAKESLIFCKVFKNVQLIYFGT